MLALLELLLPKRATEQHVAVLIYPIGEVLTGYADADSLLALKLSVVDKGQYLRDYLDSRYVLFNTTLGSQWFSFIVSVCFP